MLKSIEVVGIELLPGSRHGVDGPTALIQFSWQGEAPGPGQLQELGELLAKGLQFQERLDWKYSGNPNWRELPATMPVRSFPGDFLAGPSDDPLSALLAAGLTALQWGSLLPVAAARVLGHEGQGIQLAVPYWLPQKLEAALQILLAVTKSTLLSTPAKESAQVSTADALNTMEAALEGALGKEALELDGFYMAWQARKRDLPIVRMDFGVLEIGHGKGRRRFLGSLQGGDAVVAVQASNKLVIKRQMLRAGVPVPAYGVVADEQQALAAAQAMGWPVVLKPIDQSLSLGVTANIWRAADLLRAYRKARKVSQNPLLLERHALGHDHRLLVVDGQVVAAVGFPYVEVKGNGFQNLAELIELAKRSCSDEHTAANYRSDKESQRLIDEQGLALGDVVESGRVVQLRRLRNAPPLTGSIVDVLDTLHPDLERLAVRATAAMGMALAGLDVISPDVSQPPLASGAMLLELNPRPFLNTIRASPRFRDIDQRVFEATFPPGHNSMPIVLMDGSAGGDRLITELEKDLRDKGQVLGCWTSQGAVRVGGEEMVWTVGEESREAPGQLVLGDGRVELALLNLTSASWLKDGHPCSNYSLGVLMEAEQLLEQGLLAEWLDAIKGPVLVVSGTAALLEVVSNQVGDRMVAVEGQEAALEAVKAGLRELAIQGPT